MAVCKMCHKTIPDGRDYCEDCEKNIADKADESYLESLLDSVVANQPPENSLSSLSSKDSKTKKRGIGKKNIQKKASDDLISSSDNASDNFASDDIAVNNDIPDMAQTEDSMPDMAQTEDSMPDMAQAEDNMPDLSDISLPEIMSAENRMPDDINEDVSSNPNISTIDNDKSDHSDMDELLSSLLADMDKSDKNDSDIKEGPTLNPDDINDIFEIAKPYVEPDVEPNMEPNLGPSVEPNLGPSVEPNFQVDDDIDSLFQEIDSDIGQQPVINIQPSTEIIHEESADNDSKAEYDIEQIMDNIQSGDFEKEMSGLSDKNAVLDIKKKKKKGIIKKLFSNIKEERTPEQEEAYKAKLIAEEEAKKNRAEDKKKKSELTKQEKIQKKAEEKTIAAQKAKEKADAAKQKKEEAKLKAKKKKETKLAVMEYEVDEGRVNRLGATILFVIFAILTVFVIIGTNIYSYNLSIKNASEDFERKRYNDAYYEVYGLEIKNEDIELYDRIMTVMYVNKQLNSYYNYVKINNTEKALDSLLKGLQRYDKYLQLASILGIKDDLNYVKANILNELENEYNLNEEQARAIIKIDDSIDYSDYVYGLLGTYEGVSSE